MQRRPSHEHVLALPARMSALLQALGRGWPAAAWCALHLRRDRHHAIAGALRDVLDGDPLFRLALVRASGGAASSFARRPVAPVPIVVRVTGLPTARAAGVVARVERSLRRVDADVLATAAFVLWCDDDDPRVLLSMPAPWADRHTLQLVARRLMARLSRRGAPAADAASAPDFLQFLTWHEDFLRDPVNRTMRDRWQPRLEAHDAAHPAGAPGRGDSGSGQRRGGVGRCVRRMEAGLAALLHDATRDLGSPAEVLCGAGWRVHVGALVREAPVMIGWELDGRFTRGLDAALGQFSHAVPIEAPMSLRDSFNVVRADCETQLAFAREHEEFYDAPHVFDCAFAFEDLAGDDAPLDGGSVTIRFRLRLRVRRRHDEGYDACLDYDAAAYQRWRAERLLTGFLDTLRYCLAHPDDALSTLVEAPLAAPERHRLLVEWQDSVPNAPETGAAPLVLARFSRVCTRYRDRVALVAPDGVWTYGLLRRRAMAIAHGLVRQRVRRGARVVLFLERSPEAIAAMLGTLTAGAAYVPLSPDQPPERIAAVIADCQPDAVITTSRDASALPPSCGARILLDRLDPSIVPAAWRPRRSPAPDDPAYLLYTSGSTGQPKGVVITHANLAQSLAARLATYRADAPGYFLASPLVFDSSVAGIYWTLTAGGRLCVPPERIQDRFEEALALLHAGRVTHTLCLPSLYRVILDRADASLLNQLDTVILAGEELPRDVVAQHRQRAPDAGLYNEYGLTEASVWSTVYRLPASSAAGPIPIGRPIPGARVYVLDARLALCPVGQDGDLYLGGDALISPGYWRMPGETASKFVPDPFLGVAGGRMCKTGDRARWRVDGTLEFLGRADRQVKVRGVRIELSEIECLLMRQSWIGEVVVIAPPNARGDRQLRAFIVPRASGHTRVGDLDGIFRGAMPPQLLPIPVTLLDALPRTASGKVDATRLVATTTIEPRAAADAGDRASQSPVRALLATLWHAQLGTVNLSDTDSFWELGGNSLRAIPIISGVQRVFGVTLGLRELFETPTLGALTRRVESELRARRGSPDVDVPRGAIERPERPALSFAQQRLWFLEQLQPGRSAYHCPVAIRVDGVFSAAAWEQAFAAIVQRHDVLRTVIDTTGGRLASRLRHAPVWRSPIVDLSTLRPADREPVWSRITRADAAHPFDLARQVAWRHRLVRLDDRHAGIVLNFHHIICDLWSIEILTRELSAAYASIARGRPPALRPPARTYADFAAWLRALVSGAQGTALAARWRDLLGSFTTAAEIATDFPRPHRSRGVGARLAIRLDGEVSGRIRDLARAEQATPFFVLLAACHLLVHRASGDRDSCVGVPVANRVWPGAEDIVGLLLNTVPVPARVSPAAGFRGLLGQVRDAFLTAFAIQDLPFERIVEATGGARDPARNPLFQVFFTYQHRLASELSLPAADVRIDQLPSGAAKFDLTVGVVETADGFDVVFEYDRELFAPASVFRLAALYRHLVTTCTREPAIALDHPRLTPAHVRHQQIIEWNDTRRDWDAEPGESVHGLFRVAARRAPDRIALIEGAARLTFAVLDAWSDAIAARLETCGLATGETVGIWLPRGAAAVAAMLGVLKAGLVCVPLDPETPPARLHQVAESARLRVVVSDRLTTAPDVATAEAWPFRVVPVEPAAAAAREVNLPARGARRASHAAYVLFTSGSTDRPKGVRGSHRAFLNRCRWMWERYPITSADVCCAKAPLTFVDSFWELFGGLLQGAPLLLLGDDLVRDPRRLWHALRAHAVSRIVFIPSFLRLFLDALPDALAGLPSLRLVTVSGEPLDAAVYRLFQRAPGSAALLNLYGMTEAAADVTWDAPRSAGLAEWMPIGRPIANLTAYLLDRQLAPVGIGVPAELYLGGAGLADGYEAVPDATAARFVPHPFATMPGERLYRTGDFCCWQPDGRLRCLGRCDRQIKVRGMRVEPAEIEARLRAHPLVLDAVVRGIPSAAGLRLVAWLRLTGSDAATRLLTADERAALRPFLAAALPAHMIPAELVAMPAFPRTACGKIDSRALPRPEQIADGALAPDDRHATALERGIQRVWQQVLEAPAIPRRANFFDLGGNSFHMMQLQARLRADLGLEVDVLDLFAHPTVNDLAAFIAGARDDGPRRRALAQRVDKRRAALMATAATRTR